MRPIVLNASSPFEIHLSARQAAQTWKSFMENGTRHSGQASTLPYIIRRCEREKIAYILTAYPGEGYHIERVKKDR